MRPAAGPCLYFSQACSSGLLRGEYFHTDRLGEHPRHSVPEHAASVRRCSTYFKYPVVHIVVHCSLFMNTVRLRTLPHCAPVHQFLCSRILSVYPDRTPAGSRAARTCECRASGAFLIASWSLCCGHPRCCLLLCCFPRRWHGLVGIASGCLLLGWARASGWLLMGWVAG